MLVKDPLGSLLDHMHSNLKTLVSQVGLREEVKCVLDLLATKANPLDIMNYFPLFYSLDRQIIFLFAVSNDRFAQKDVLGEKDWRSKILDSSPRWELLRQENRPHHERQFDEKNMMDFAIFL